MCRLEDSKALRRARCNRIERDNLSLPDLATGGLFQRPERDVESRPEPDSGTREPLLSLQRDAALRRAGDLGTLVSPPGTAMRIARSARGDSATQYRRLLRPAAHAR